MIVDRYYYGKLNNREQAIYRAFYKGLMEHKKIIPIPVKGNLSEDVVMRIFSAITRDNPLIYYLNQSAFNVVKAPLGHSAFSPQYFYDEKSVKKYNKKIEETVNDLAGNLKLTEGTDYEKEVKIHDWICENVEYDYDGDNKKEPGRMAATHNILGVFANHKAQCEGIAKAVKVLLNAVDIKCIVVTGTAVEKGIPCNHAWNIVSIANDPYYLDVTWDIGAKGKGNDRIPYDYFNITDRIIGKDHTADHVMPACSSSKLNYFSFNKLVFRSKSRILAYVSSGLEKGIREFYFKVEGKMDFKDLVIEIAKISEDKGFGSQVIHIVNDKAGTCWVKV